VPPQLPLRIFLGVALPLAARAAGAGFDVRAYGAAGDGHTLDSPAINSAIAAAHAAGGGTVVVPAGTYLAGSIHLLGNVTVDLEPGSVIVATSEDAAYDPPEPNEWGDRLRYQDFGHSHWHNSLIWAEDAQNLGIVGTGRIYGLGLARDWIRDRPNLGNKAIALKNCRNVVLRDFTIAHGGWFGILATAADSLTIDNLRIDTNRDGMDIDCCRDVRISNCSVNSPLDDGICLKSSYALGCARATENVTISDCEVSGFDEGTMLDGTRRRGQGYPTGRIKFGTESNGGFRNIAVSNCVFDSCRGLALETVDGGDLEDVAITNLTMRDIVNSPIFLRIGARLRGPAGIRPARLTRVTISHVVAHGVTAEQGILIAGLKGSVISDVSLSDILIDFAGGGTVDQSRRQLPELEKGYPEPGSFGVLPSYGLYARHASNLTLDHVRFVFDTEDQRPAMYLEDIDGCDLSHVQAARTAGVPALEVRDVRSLTSDASPDLQPAP
jgi:polygalacturonase